MARKRSAGQTLFDEMSRSIPATRDIFRSAVERASSDLATRTSSPGYHSDLLQRTMEIAEEIYRSSEREAFARHAAPHLTTSTTHTERWAAQHFIELQDLFMSLFQSRKARAGETLQHAFAAVLDAQKIPYDAQAVINGQPDFVVPSAEKYARYPAKTRVIACKQTVRERWMQIIPESRNAGLFYLVTIDQKVSSKALAEMARKRVNLVVPDKIKREVYPDEENVESIDTFLKGTIRLLSDS